MKRIFALALAFALLAALFAGCVREKDRAADRQTDVNGSNVPSQTVPADTLPETAAETDNSIENMMPEISSGRI